MATIEIDGKQVEAEAGRMIIEVADEMGVHIPRFCYHKKLSVVANCRMCLVQVARSGKPLPACATPVTDGMKVYTKSAQAIAAQKAVMEFLLINHPLDCPICDQGGECELQDVSLGYGNGLSEFSEQKRAVADEDLGPLVATEMTRCIHCTRCVRFGEEVAGIRELGATGRGEQMKIGTYIKHSLQSEVSGNIIDLCPVGALTSKPYRFTARAWELQQHQSIAAHDCLGSHIALHVLKQEIMRVIPKAHESINETWLSDRDRFSYLGLNSPERAQKPMIKVDGQWEKTDWQTALDSVLSRLQKALVSHGPEKMGALISPNATVEESYLFQKLMRALNCPNIDHRLREVDFRDQVELDAYPGMTLSYQALSDQDCFLLIGSHLNHEQPLAATRLRRAIAERSAKVLVINAFDHDLYMPVSDKALIAAGKIVQFLAEIAAVLYEQQIIPESAQALLAGVMPSASAERFAEQLKSAEKAVLILGALAQHHAHAAEIRSLSKLIAFLANGKICFMSEGSNRVGCHLAGALPHRLPATQKADKIGLNVAQMWSEALPIYFLQGFEPEYDTADPNQAIQALKHAECVVVCTAYQTEAMLDYADVILPTTPFSETSGTRVNVAGDWQSFRACVSPKGEARPFWKVLRVLANLFDLEGFSYEYNQEVLQELQEQLGDKAQYQPDEQLISCYWPEALSERRSGLARIGLLPMYAVDPVVRRAEALQASQGSQKMSILVNAKLAQQYNLQQGRSAEIIQNGVSIDLPVTIDEAVADDSIYLVAGLPETAMMGSLFGAIEIR